MKKPPKTSFLIGRKKYGEVVQHECGRTTLIVQRSLKDIFKGEGRDRNGYIAHAKSENIAAWSIETLLLSKCKSRKIDFIAVKVRETKEIYMTPLSRFIHESRVMTQRRRNRSMQRSLTLDRFRKSVGVVKV